MNRWKMHKLGFVNFWLYDHEEFLIKDGHILLRGNNASGKSITTQSFIPFLLDGNKSPERLDPFGSRDRKMDFYLLGDGEREESTGYLYLEFKKADTEEFLTIGIGMRAQKGKGIDFWGFCLCDGRRIGPGGISLYEKLGGQMLPLTKQKLRNLIGDENNWAEAPGTYKQLVNDRVFQFRDIRQYDQLIQLLIKVRTPKLSKESFRPSEVKKILNESLQVLTDEDLSAMVSTMERMDALEDTLRDLRSAMRDASTIRNEYSRYNQYMLGMKGQAYLKAHTKTLQLQNELQDAKTDPENLERYYNCGILCDSISSSVTQVGVHLYTDTEEHPAYRAFRLRNEAGTLTLTNLAGIKAASSPSGNAYLVENQMVFSQLCDQAPHFHSPLICTSGQPTVAVFRLLDMLVSSGTKLFYSGDFDGKGLSIALQLLARYPDHLYLWHMTPADYARCCSDVHLSEASLALLHTCANTALAPTAEAIERKGYDGYQELLLSELLADLIDT